MEVEKRFEEEEITISNYCLKLLFSRLNDGNASRDFNLTTDLLSSDTGLKYFFFVIKIQQVFATFILLKSWFNNYRHLIPFIIEIS